MIGPTRWKVKNGNIVYRLSSALCLKSRRCRRGAIFSCSYVPPGSCHVRQGTMCARHDCRIQWPCFFAELDHEPGFSLPCRIRPGVAVFGTPERLIRSVFLAPCARARPRGSRLPKIKAPGTQESKFRVSFGPEQSKTPLDGRLLVMLSTDPARRAAISDHREPKDAADFRYRR